MVFIVFMVFVIQGQIDEKMKIKELYDKLYQTAGELKIVNIQLQNYAKKSEEMAKTRERNRLAREIHDTLGHALTGIATGLEACIQIIDHNKEQTKKQLIKIIDLAKKGLLDVRRSVSELRPDALNRFLLIPAIQRLTEDINECTNTKVALFVNRETANLRPDEEETIYRIIQEGITNAVRHGKAKEIKVELCFETNHVQLEIADDGVGCSHPVEGFGLKHIKERIQMLAGWVKFESLIPSGFKISARIPIRGGLDNDSAFDSGRPGINQTKSGDYVEQ
jgi:signal transduction histidine kinase